MVSLVQLGLPILLGAVGVFVASALIHMVFGFWHNVDYRGFNNEDDVAAALRKGNPAPGIYMVPYCQPADMKKPEVQEKFKRGPLVFMFLRAGAPMAMGKSLTQWFVFCLVVSLFAGYVAGATLASGTAYMQVFRVTATAAFMAFGFSSVPSGIWWGQPWGPVFKDMVDGLIYGLIIGAVFACLWPAAAAAA